MFWVDKDTSTECQLDVYQESLRDTIREKRRYLQVKNQVKINFLVIFLT